MARQMVFTSTPQGLEPGRTGFCTVARHRSLRSRLVRELERTSVYEFNLAQGATKAKINSFRHFELGTEEFYVLTRIRDAGLDYTNRTNYIAHHLIFDGLEIAVNPSPAEIFLQWTDWLDVWEGSPRWFEDDEITDVSSCKMTGLSPAQSWQSATGDGGNAAYLIAEKAKRPVLLEVLPGEEDKLLHLFAESCALVPLPMEAWQFPFTTFLQETDDAKDFAWIGGCGQTAVERLKHNGVPNHLNLTAFDQRSVKDPMDEKLVFIARNGRKAAIEKKTPPPPPVAEPAGAGGTVGAGPGSPSTTISPGRSGDAFSRTEKQQFRQAAASHAAAQATAATTGGDGSKKRRKRPKWPWITAIAAVMLLAIFVAYQAGLFEAMMKPSGDGDPLTQGGGAGPNGGGGKKPDVPPDEPDPNVKPPDSPAGIAIGVPTLAKVTAKDERFNSWIEFQVGQAEPTKIDLTAMTNADYERFGDKLRDLDVGASMTMTFREGSEPGRFAIANLAPPPAPLRTSGTDNPPTIPSGTPLIPGAPVAVESVFSGNEVALDERDLSVALPPSDGVVLPPYRFLPSQKARFFHLQNLLKTSRKVKYSYRIVDGRISDFDFSVVPRVDPLSGSPSVHSLSAPPPFPVTESFVLWLTKAEVENRELASTSIHGDAAFVHTLKTKLDRIASTEGRAFVWGTGYVGPQAFVEVSRMDGSRRYTVVHRRVFEYDRYTLETPQDEGSTLFLRFLFKSASEVDILFETQGARNAAKGGVLLRLPDLETNRALDLYLLSPRVVGAKPNGLAKEHLSMDRNRVTMAKNGAFGHGLRAIGSAGPFTLKLSVNPSERVFYGSNLRPSDFTSQKLKSFPLLLVKSVPEDPMICELALFIDYMLDLRKEFQREIDKLNAGNNDEFAVKMPKPKIFDALKFFGKRAGYSHDSKPGAGKGTYGPFMIDVTMNFFKQVHGYSDEASDLLEKDLVLDPKGFMLDAFQHREFWKKVCARAKQEASAPFSLGYDPKNLARDIDRVIGTLRFLRESERAFGIKDQGIDQMISGTVNEIMDRDNGSINKLYNQLMNYKDTPEGKAAIPKYSAEWNKYLADFVKVGAPVELTTAEFRKAINCIEDPVLAEKYQDRHEGFKAQTAQQQLGSLKYWLAELGKEIDKKDPRVASGEYEPSRKQNFMKSYFHSEEWSLSLFRDGQGQDELEAELIRFNRN